LEILKKARPNLLFYFVSAEVGDKTLEKALSYGASGVLEKPLQEEEIKEKLSCSGNK
jgi:AmiR/NasT family two-component response regulator